MLDTSRTGINLRALAPLKSVQQGLPICSSLHRVSPGFSAQVLKVNPDVKDIDSFTPADFELVGYEPNKRIAMKMAV